MNNMSDIIEKAREYLENVTPFKGDCGTLCDSLCCKKRDENGKNKSDSFGMWLFPGEDKLFENNVKFKVTQADGNNSYPFLLCGYSGENHDFCKREERPLFCRFFPYFPVVKNIGGKFKVKIIVHPTALRMCPIITSKLNLRITSDFSRAVKKAVYTMINDDKLRKYLTETGEYLESMSEFAQKIL
ncbi:MAG: hypothetical protein FWD71_11185 [Oscillospiraceae bacterium]|nr:hypothetical protein [Oscillospiraceae bacterium]